MVAPNPSSKTMTLFLKRSTKPGGSPLPARLQNRTCRFPAIRLLSGLALGMSTSARLLLSCLVGVTMSMEPLSIDLLSIPPL
jgi:hypothetical protein